LAIVAVLFIAWFAVFVRNERIGHAASKRIIAAPAMDEGEFARAISDFRRAELLDPGTKWMATRASYLMQRGDKQAALRAADSALRREPDNIDAWAVVLRATRGRDARRAAEATRELRRLNPLPARSR
jgi:tetratricopeptide (TPR) repeat protein